MQQTIKIATRKSPLALWQAGHGCTIRRIEQVPTFAPCGKSLMLSKLLDTKASNGFSRLSIAPNSKSFGI
jgi:hypothetical protein